MTTYISILRGINVSGHRMIKMEALKKICTDLNFTNVQTYIQSGNIIFQSKMTDSKKISETITKNIAKVFDFDVPVITLTQTELETVINSNPFLNDKSKNPAFLHVTFLSDKPVKQNIEQLRHVDLKNDNFEIVDKAIYLYCPDSYSKSKLTNSLLETKLKVTATTRNWKTTNELFKMTTKL
ncbi:hypothetical protein A4D02_27840 [Niastella koreensis]|uniref:DUF1697 domain-containing protein n=2 Tax=Niastella koreensis TaxID=354356 RepID=G8TI41_NIAKG|nr:DUF1697 domain-containing protein [Niastella koreensis]AEV99644.1 protein of unknown function DUF1697 [Niastella koreensis GR20-10]OQP49891.1 hypothetical protein A4D02_27840 [Niastella koreensis]